MDLVSELYERTAAFVDGRITLVDFRDWIADASEAADQDGPEAARALSGRIWRHLSERGYGHLNDAELCDELSRLLAAVADTWDRQNPVAITVGIAFSRTGHVAARERVGYQPGILQLVN
jgi:hypothetical protein